MYFYVPSVLLQITNLEYQPWMRGLSSGHGNNFFNHLFELSNCFYLCLGYFLGDIKNALQNSLVIYLFSNLKLFQLTRICSKLARRTSEKGINLLDGNKKY